MEQWEVGLRKSFDEAALGVVDYQRSSNTDEQCYLKFNRKSDGQERTIVVRFFRSGGEAFRSEPRGDQIDESSEIAPVIDISYAGYGVLWRSTTDSVGELTKCLKDCLDLAFSAYNISVQSTAG